MEPDSSSFHIDWLAFCVLLGFAFLYMILRGRRFARGSSVHFGFSDLSVWSASGASWRVRLSWIPRWCLLVAAAAFAMAFLDPHLLVPREPPPTDGGGMDSEGETKVEAVELPSEGVALYLVLDRSGSMGQELAVKDRGRGRRVTRIEFLRQVTAQFIRKRPNDLIGLVAFARAPEILSPLTLDHSAVLEQLSKLDTVKDPSHDGTAMGYAIYKTAHLIAATRLFAEQLSAEGKASYEIKSTAIVLVTDGLQNPNPLDADHERRALELTDAVSFAREQDLRLYIVNVEPAILRPEFKAYREQMEYAAQETGGVFFIADTASRLAAIYEEIDRLETSALPGGKSLVAEVRERYRDAELAEKYRRVSFYPYLLGLGLIFMGLGIGLDTTYLRRAP